MTTADLLSTVALVAAVGSGVVAGLFSAFSVAVMPGLRRLTPTAGAVAMQSMNRAILNPVFGVVFGGTTLACLVLAVGALVAPPGGTWRLVGAALYVVGAFLVTVVVNVPLNNRLAAADPDGVEGARLWASYLSRWTAWNHVRALASVAATALLVVGG